MRIKRANDTSYDVRIGDMDSGDVFYNDETKVSYLVTDEYFTEDWDRCEPDDGERRLVVSIADGCAMLYHIDEEYPLVDGAFVEGA